jgi:Zn-dependent protease
MFGTGNRFQVAKIAGVPIYLSSTWLVIAALFSFGYYSLFSEQMAANEALQLTILFAVLFFGGILLHEAAHAIAARAFGLPVRGITLVFWGGYTETRSWRMGPLADVVVAAAGPATTAILGVIFLAWSEQLPLGSDTGYALRNLGELNLVFAIVNAIPGFPLDGGRILMAGAWAVTRNRARAQRIAAAASVGIGGVLIAWAVMEFLGGGRFGSYAFFLGLIGFTMISVGRQMPARAALRERLLRGTAQDAMRPVGEAISASTPLMDATERYLRTSPHRSFPVYEDGSIVGTISLDDAAQQVASSPVRVAMVQFERPPTTVAVDEPLDDVVEWIGGRQAQVVDTTGRTVGLLDLRDVDRWLREHWSTGQYVERPALSLPPRPDR